MENSTNTVPNTVATSGSTGTDLNGMATLVSLRWVNNSVSAQTAPIRVSGINLSTTH